MINVYVLYTFLTKHGKKFSRSKLLGGGSGGGGVLLVNLSITFKLQNSCSRTNTYLFVKLF